MTAKHPRVLVLAGSYPNDVVPTLGTLACGTPVVATRYGRPEATITSDDGLLVPVGDANALVDALIAVLADPGQFAADALRSYALERFAWDSVVERILDVYRVCLN